VSRHKFSFTDPQHTSSTCVAQLDGVDMFQRSCELDMSRAKDFASAVEWWTLRRMFSLIPEDYVAACIIRSHTG
jgi:hypothetical protein